MDEEDFLGTVGKIKALNDILLKENLYLKNQVRDL